MSCLASSYIPDADSTSHISNANLFHSAGPKVAVHRCEQMHKFPCGVRFLSFGIYILRLSQGIVLTWVGLWDFSVIRAAAYKRQSFQIAT